MAMFKNLKLRICCCCFSREWSRRLVAWFVFMCSVVEFMWILLVANQKTLFKHVFIHCLSSLPNRISHDFFFKKTLISSFCGPLVMFSNMQEHHYLLLNVTVDAVLQKRPLPKDATKLEKEALFIQRSSTQCWSLLW